MPDKIESVKPSPAEKIIAPNPIVEVKTNKDNTVQLVTIKTEADGTTVVTTKPTLTKKQFNAKIDREVGILQGVIASKLATKIK